MSFSLSTEQMKVCKLLESTRDNYFLTGKAGTGKSTIIRYFLENTNKKCVVVAPTGLAALNANGTTLHSFFRLGAGVQHPDNISIKNEFDEEMYCALDTLIIDEVSMVRVDYMDTIDAILKKARKDKKPFGGCQIIAVGDLYQLPPFGDNEDVERYLFDKYHSLFFFRAPVFSDHPIKIIELQEVHRQNDPRFKDILNSIREGVATKEHLADLNERRVDPPSDINCITLVASNIAVNQINERNLAALPGTPKEYVGSVSGDFNKRELPTEEILKLKVDAKVIFIKNGDDKNGTTWVNGSMGTVMEMKDDEIIVKLEDGKEAHVEKTTWENIRYVYNRATNTLEKEEIGSFRQFPLKLAYAITIHKSQGKTFSHVEIDYSASGSFAPGQTYVALSRCTSLAGLYLKKELKDYDVRVNPEVIFFMHGKTSNLLPANPTQLTWEGNTVRVSPIQNPKRISGRRLLSVLGANKYETPFAVWCEMMRIYDKPFQDNQFTQAGRIIEEKQYQYIADRIQKGGNRYSIVTPDDYFGQNAKSLTGYNFFSDEIFGGMWDYLLMDGGQLYAVAEMKTTRDSKRTVADEKAKFQEAYIQAALYATLLGLKNCLIVLSYLKPEDYDHPEKYVCTEDNTVMQNYKVKESFQQDLMQKARDWWKEHILTGKSPEYDEARDHDVLVALRNR